MVSKHSDMMKRLLTATVMAETPGTWQPDGTKLGTKVICMA